MVGVIEKKKTISPKSRRNRIISGTIIAILLIVTGALLLPSFWFWVCWEILAALLVARGCIAEWYLFRFPAASGMKTQHRASELKAIAAVAIGVTMEVFGVSHSIREGIKMEAKISDVELTNARTSLRIEELRRANNELDKEAANAKGRAAELELATAEINRQAASRALTPDQDRTLVKELVKTPSNSVTVITAVGDPESSDFADDFEAALVRARWSISRTEWNSMKIRPFRNSLPTEPEPKNWPQNGLGDWLTYSALMQSRTFFLPQRLSGILVAHNPKALSLPASALISALGNVKGLQFTDLRTPDTPTGTAWLMIAPKPSFGLRSFIPRAFHPSIDASNNLSKFAWTNANIIPDPQDSFDTVRLSEQIAAVLNGVKMLNTNLPAWMLNERPFGEGVTVEATASLTAAKRAGYTEDSRWMRWREVDQQRTALVEELNGAGIAAEKGWLGPSAPFGWIVIRIGPSPGREALRRHQEMQFEETNLFHFLNK